MRGTFVGRIGACSGKGRAIPALHSRRPLWGSCRLRRLRGAGGAYPLGHKRPSPTSSDQARQPYDGRFVNRTYIRIDSYSLVLVGEGLASPEGRTDCRIAALLAMTGGPGPAPTDTTQPRPVKAPLCKGGSAERWQARCRVARFPRVALDKRGVASHASRASRWGLSFPGVPRSLTSLRTGFGMTEMRPGPVISNQLSNW